MSEGNFERQRAAGVCSHGNFSPCRVCDGENSETREPHETDLENHENIERILVSGTDSELAKLRDHYKLDQIQIERLCHYARLRSSVHDEMTLELHTRLDQDPNPTEGELEAGTFIENIEPQVRMAVLDLRKKGYSTWESGFMGVEGEQRISFEEELPANFKPSTQLVESLVEKGVVLQIEPSAISYTTDRILSVEEMKDIWSNIQEEIPALDKPAKQSTLPNAVAFREKYR